MGWMMETLLTTTRRSEPAASRPWLNAPRTMASRPNRNRATANDPRVSVVRIFLRNRLATMRWRYFNAVLPPCCRLYEPPPVLPYPGAAECVRAPPPPGHGSPAAPFCRAPLPDGQSGP